MNLCKPTLLALAITTVATAGGSPSVHSASPRYHVAQIYPIGGTGGWDYLTVDSARKLLYVPRSTHTMVLNADTGAVVADIPGQTRNHGVALVPSAGRGFITDGKDASVTIFDLRTFAVLGKIKMRDDADGIIYDPAARKLLVVCGDAGVLIPFSPEIDPRQGTADPAIELGGNPEFLAADGRGRAYVNLVNKDQVAVVDLHTMKVTAHWSTAPGGMPVGMAIDGKNRLLFIGCRKPQTMVVMDCDNGRVLASLPIGAGVDAVEFDGGNALASCGDGTLTVVGESAPGHFAVLQTVETRKGARTAGLDPATHTLYLPTAEFAATIGKNRPRPNPATFMILKVARDQ